MNTPAPGSRHAIVLLAASVMPIMAIVSLIPVLPLLQREFAAVAGAEFLVPMALTIPALCVALLSPVAGWLADRFGRKRLLVLALIGYAVSGILPWFAASLPLIIAARLVLGMLEAVIMTVATVMIGDYFTGAEREKWIAMQVAIGGVAATVLIALGGVLGDALGSRGPFTLYLLAIPVAVVAALVLFEPDTRPSSGTAAAGAFPHRTVLPLAAVTVGVGIVFYTVNVKLGPILEISGRVSPGGIGVVGALCNVSIGLGSLLFHRLKRHTGMRLLALGLGIAAVGYGGVGASAGFEAIAAFAIVACFGGGIALPNMLNWTMSVTPPESRGRGMGLWTGAFFLGQFLAPLVVATVVKFSGTLNQALTVYALAIATSIALLLLPSVLRQVSQGYQRNPVP